MSKFYTLLLTLTCLFAIQAQDCDTIIFDNSDYNDLIKVDGVDGPYIRDYDENLYNTDLGMPDSAGSFHWYYELLENGDTNIFFRGYSAFATADTADNWYYYRNVPVDEKGLTISWKHRYGINTARDGYYIDVWKSDFSGRKIIAAYDDNSEFTDGDTTWTQQTVTIDTFLGEDVHIYFSHYAIDQSWVDFDDIVMTVCTESSDDTTVIDDTTIIDDTTSNSDTVIIVDTVTNTDTVVVVEGDTVYTTIYDTIIITETIEVPGDDITATIVIDIEGTCNDISTGMTEGDFTANELTAYPNPVLDVLNIQINNTSSISGSFTLNIYAIDGSLVKTETISSTATVDLSSLEAGFHVIEVIGANEVLAHQKFLKN